MVNAVCNHTVTTETRVVHTVTPEVVLTLSLDEARRLNDMMPDYYDRTGAQDDIVDALRAAIDVAEAMPANPDLNTHEGRVSFALGQPDVLNATDRINAIRALRAAAGTDHPTNPGGMVIPLKEAVNTVDDRRVVSASSFRG